MFCYNCGKKVLNGQKFCCHCGAENSNYVSTSDTQTISNDINPSSSVHQINTIFNRDVLNNYLNNLRTLEFAKNKLTNEKNNLEYRINSLGHKNDIPENLTDFETPLCGIGFMAVFFIIALIINAIINGDGFFSIFSFIQPIVTFVLYTSPIIAILCVVWMIYDKVKDRERYINDIKYEEKRMKSELYEKQKLSDILPSIEQDLEQTEVLLNDAYSINLIPEKYRNIYAAYFLYEYISTSTVTLNEALFHCDLDEISRKLDVIIEQQRETIMELARSNALNEQIVQQNEQILRNAIKSETNTALAAQYAQIAAINSNTVAQIQSYYFFKNGL